MTKKTITVVVCYVLVWRGILCYAMLCYSDFQGAKNLNPNFILTRTKTIMMGDEYCDFCYHDTQKVKEITHPSEKEFQELG